MEKREKKLERRAFIGLFFGGIGLFLVFCLYTIIEMIFPLFIDPYSPLLSLVFLFFALLVGVAAGFFAAQEERLVVAKDGARIGAWVGGIAGAAMSFFGPLFLGAVVLSILEIFPFPFVTTWIERFIFGFWELAFWLTVVSALSGAGGGYLRASSVTAEDFPNMDDNFKDKLSKLAGFLINLLLSGEVRDDDLGGSTRTKLLRLNFLMLALGVAGAVLVVAYGFYNPEDALFFQDNLRFVVGGIIAGFALLLALFFVLKGLFWGETDDSIKRKLISNEVQDDDTGDSLKGKLITWAGLLTVLGVGGALFVVANEFYDPEGDLSFDNLRFLAICFGGFTVLLGLFFLLKDYFVDDTDDSAKGRLIKLAYYTIALGVGGAIFAVVYEFANPEGDLSFDNLKSVGSIFAGAGVLIGLVLVLIGFVNDLIYE